MFKFSCIFNTCRGSKILIRGSKILIFKNNTPILGSLYFLSLVNKNKPENHRGSKILIRGSKILIRGPKILFWGSKILIRGSKTLFQSIVAIGALKFYFQNHRGSKILIRGSKILFKMLPRGSKMLPRGSKMLPRGSKMLKKGSKMLKKGLPILSLYIFHTRNMYKDSKKRKKAKKSLEVLK